MQSCDVLIVGGGPAGSTCAWRLRRAGLDVLVVDKREFPRDKTCAGWVTPAVIETLRLDTQRYAHGRVFQPITGFRVGRIGGPVVETRYDTPVSYGIRRCEFDHYLLERSATAGARLRLGVTLKTLERFGDRWRVNGEIEAPMLVGAGGHFCPVARFLSGKPDGGETLVAAQEIEFPLSREQQRDCLVEREVPELYFCEDLKGYAWAFRKGDYLNVGLGREDKEGLSDHVRGFALMLKNADRIPADTPDRFHGHAYILYGHAKRELLGDGVLLVGDSAGLAYPQSGEGIRTAVESAVFAADTIAAAAGSYGRERLAPYESLLRDRFGDPDASDGWARHLPEGIKRGLAGKLLSTHWFARHVVIDRWFLHQHQPALAT